MVDKINTPENVDQRNKSVAALRQGFLNDLAWVLADPRGRNVFLDVLERAGAFGKIWSPGVEIHKRAATHDFGLDLQQDIMDVSPQRLTEMILERFNRLRPREADKPSKQE